MEPHVFVIFGASGDLAKRKLVPALFELFKNGHLEGDFVILGASRTEYTDESFRDMIFLENELLDKSGVEAGDLDRFSKQLFYQPVNTKDGADYVKIRTRVDELNEQFNTQGNVVFYLSTPPELYGVIPEYLAQHGLNDCSKGWKRLIIEKPFGYDFTSAKELNTRLQQFFPENNIYRIDHYLGKETVQNMLVTRFSNGIFEPLWNRNYVERIEITASESLGVGSRGGYYDNSGALRDMLQNHLLQIVAHIAMEPPIDTDAQSIRNEKMKLFQSIRPIAEEDVEKFAVRGQYIESKVRGEVVKGYRQEEGVPEESKTETYIALKFYIDNWRWAGVPFFVRTGKCLPTKVTEAIVTFKNPPHTLFRREDQLMNAHNQLVMRIQPDEGLLLRFGMKIPGAGFNVKDVDMDFHYADLGETDIPEAYERLIFDCIKGDATLYSRADSIEEAWSFVQPILDAWKNNPAIKVYGYPAGTWGPTAADELMENGGQWRNPCKNLTNQENYCEL